MTLCGVGINQFLNNLYIFVSQSGETADTAAALDICKENKVKTCAVVNVVESSIARNADWVLPIHAGPEVGVASTKAFTAQVTVLTLLALGIADIRGKIARERLREMFAALDTIPQKVEKLLESCNEKCKEIAAVYADSPNCLYLGRGYNFPTALEGALKLKEISYIHAEGYPAAEMKHGPIALIDENMPVVVVAPKHSYYEKVLSNIQEVKARKGKIIAIVTEGDKKVAEIADHYIEIPDTEDCLTPILATIPLQLISYYIALIRGCNVDQPRNLAKSA